MGELRREYAQLSAAHAQLVCRMSDAEECIRQLRADIAVL